MELTTFTFIFFCNLLTAAPSVQNSYGYTYNYDAASRLTAAVGTANAYNETLSYDANGNILALGRTNASATTIDNLAYTYPTLRNRLTSISESSSNTEGYKALATGNYTYDMAGNTTYDLARQMSTSYDSYLGLTKQQTLPNSQTITYDYSSQGTKLRRTTNLPTSQTTHYIGAFEYEQTGTASPTLSMIHLPGGRAIPNANGVKYEYYLTDHLGNVRMVFDNNNGEARIVQQSHYYPFGLTQTLYDNASQNKYLYNGKELEATNLYDFGARQIPHDDPRFRQNDPLAEYYYFQSPYVYGANNPVRFRDVNGMGPGDFYDEKAKKLGTDGVNDQKVYVVTNKEEQKQISKTDKAGGTTKTDDVTSEVELPSANVRAEMGSAVERSNKRNDKRTDEYKGDDDEGGFHEEGGMYGTDANGKPTVVHSKPGKKADPTVVKKATVTPADPANLGQELGFTPMGSFHVHPSGVQTIYGQIDALGNGSSTQYSFKQNPTEPDDFIEASGNTGNSYVLGAGNKTVYIYNGTNVITTFPLNQFIKIGNTK